MAAHGPVSLVVTDLDGTLWHTDDNIDDGVVEAMGALAAHGVPLLVATGRRLTSTRLPLARVGAAPPAVVLNGALGVDLATGARFHRAPYPRAQAMAVQAAFASIELAPVVYVDHPRYDVFLAPVPSTHPDHARRLAPLAGVDDLARVAAEEAVLGFGMIGVPHRDGTAACEAVGDLAACHLDRSLDHPGLASLTVAPQGLSKWDGVLAFCTAHGLDAGRVLAVADGPNDIELLDHAAVRLVPAVAHPAALERADHVIPPATDGGWSAVLDHIS
ncbi:MAG TPA: HAD family hydrolase [Acidimicrobiales bacterium]